MLNQFVAMKDQFKSDAAYVAYIHRLLSRTTEICVVNLCSSSAC
jgi:hypothetical protein